MSNRYNIRWRESDNENLKRTVKNFNAKITRLEKKYDRLIEEAGTFPEKLALRQEKAALPQRVSVKEVRQLVSTRQDFNREIKSLKRFSSKGAEKVVSFPGSQYNIKTTAWQRTEMKRRAAIINRHRAKRLEELQSVKVTRKGEPVGYTLGEFGMGDQDKLALEPINLITESMTRTQFNDRFKTVKKHSQSNYFDKTDKRLLDNYIKGLKATYNEKDIEEVLEKISSLSFNEFYKVFKATPDLMAISSDPEDLDDKYEEMLEEIRSTWIPVKDEK